MAQNLESWKPFLPPHATVMVRRGAEVKSVTATLEPLVGEGDPHARLVFVGFDALRSASSLPLFTKMIEAMGLRREQVFIAPVQDALRERWTALGPKITVVLDSNAMQLLSGVSATPQRGQWVENAGRVLLLTHHPDYLLTNPLAKREAWADLQSVMKKLGL